MATSPLASLYIGDRPAVLIRVGDEDTTPPPVDGFPTATSVGIDAIEGWEPATVIDDSDLQIFEEDAVFEDVRFDDCWVTVSAPNVTFTRCEWIGTGVFNTDGGPNLGNGLLVEDSTIRFTPPGSGNTPGSSSIGIAGFTMQRCSMLDVNEGFRVGGSSAAGLSLMDPAHPLGYGVDIIDCYVRIIPPTPLPPGFDWHGDAWQCLDTGLPGGGVPCTIRNSAFYAIDTEDGGANSLLFTKTGHSLPLDVDGLIMSGSGYGFYNAVGGSYSNMYFEDGTFSFGAILTEGDDWDIVTHWENVAVCTITDGQPDEILGYIPFGYESGPYDPP